MQTASAIQASAQVVRITTVKVGDVYKRFDESYDDRVSYGIVRAIHNDGETSIIEATEYQYRYSTLDVLTKLFEVQRLRNFPATPEEMSLELTKAKRDQQRKVEEAHETIEKSTKLIQEIDGLISGETQKSLTAMSYKELTQEQYNERKALLAS